MDTASSEVVNNGSKSGRVIAWTIALAVLAALPWIFMGTDYADYLTYLVVRIMILGLFAMSYDIVFGYTGMLSMGHALFQGAAAYTIAILMMRLGLKLHDALLPILAALVVGAALAWVQGFLACRLGPMAIFLVTFATAETLFLIIIADPLGITNSENGIAGISRDTLMGFLNIKPEINFYYLVLVLLAASYFALRAVTRSPFGDTLTAIRENPQRARYLGYRVKEHRIAAFMISGFFASLSGSLTALHETSVAPEMLAVVESAFPFLFTTLGGAGTLIGPILGTAVMVVFIEIISDYVHYYMVFVALSIVLLIMFLPGGFYSLFHRDRSRGVLAETP